MYGVPYALEHYPSARSWQSWVTRRLCCPRPQSFEQVWRQSPRSAS